MAKTANGLVSFAWSKLGTNYVYGMKGVVMTKSKYDYLKSRYPSYVRDTDVNKVGTVCVDCSGLISWYTGVSRGSSQHKSNATKVLSISQINQAVPGCALWRSGHIGIYIGNGQCIEARGSAYGTVLTNVSERDFTHILWLKDIDYTEATVSNTDTLVATGSVYMRTEPIKTSKAICILRKGNEVRFIKDCGNGWSNIEYNGKVGYTSNKYLTGKALNNDASAGTTIKQPTTLLVTASSLVHRSAPTSLATKLGSMKKGAEVQFLSDTGWGWSNIVYNGKNGFASNSYLSGKSLSGKKKCKNTSTGRINIRSSVENSGSDKTIIGKIPAKAQFVVDGFTFDSRGYRWMDVTYGTVRGWVFYDESYITFV